jgi:hypothetical protein
MGVVAGLVWWVWAGGVVEVAACATCFGASDSPMAQGMNYGILTLLGVIGFVLLGVVTFFGYLAWRMSRVGAGERAGMELEAAGELTRAEWR